MSKRYVVLSEHTLGIIYDARPTWMEVLQGSVLRYGRSWLNGPVSLLGYREDEIRPATLADFDAYRVHPKGHLT